jgi:DNA-binding CsgD family transcriptional regulator
MQSSIPARPLSLLVALHHDIGLPAEDTPLPSDLLQPMVDSNQQKEHGYALQSAHYTIGRHPEHCQILIARRRITISGQHARLERDETGYTISDCQSVNGTYINGNELDRDLAQPHRLQHQDEISLGPGKTLLLRFLTLPITTPSCSIPTKATNNIEDTSTLLTRREQQVLALLAFGRTHKAIAQELAISDHTVNAHLKSIYSKLDARNKNEAIDRARREGLV